MPRGGAMLEATARRYRPVLTAGLNSPRLLTGDPEILDDGDLTWQVVDLRP